MTAAQLRTLLHSLGLTQTGAAALIGKNPRTVRKWVLEEAPVDETAARFLWLMQALGIGSDEVTRLLEPFVAKSGE